MSIQFQQHDHVRILLILLNNVMGPVHTLINLNMMFTNHRQQVPQIIRQNMKVLIEVFMLIIPMKIKKLEQCIHKILLTMIIPQRILPMNTQHSQKLLRQHRIQVSNRNDSLVFH